MANRKVEPDLRRVVLAVTVPQWLIDAVTDAAKQDDITKSDMVERALVETYGFERGSQS